MANISQINIPNGNSSTTYDINAKKVNSHTVDTDVPANAVFTDTENTAGSTDTSSKIFLVGTTSQTSSATTYSHDTVYVGTDGHAYSNSKQVVNLSDSQALTNKTYNGYTLGAACAKSVDTTVISGSAKLVTSGGVYSALADKLKVEVGSGAGSRTSFAMSVDSSKTNSCWLIFFGGTYVGVLTRFNNTITLTKLAGSITATATLESGSVIAITTNSVPWTQLRYVALFAG